MTTCSIGFELANDEYFFNIIPEPITPPTLTSYIPKMMPKIGMGSSKVFWKEGISRGIFCNAAECKPSPSSTVGMQNFVTLTPFPNENPSFPRKENPPRSYMMKRHNKFILRVLNGDIRSLHFTGRM